MSERPVAPSHALLARLLGDIQLTGNISQDVPTFLYTSITTRLPRSTANKSRQWPAVSPHWLR